jgi:iron(II)-dependent oxidoreductase
MVTRYHWKIIGRVLLLLMCFSTAQASELNETSGGETFSGPVSSDDRDAWLASLKQWRLEQKARINYDDSIYNRPELAWTRRNYVQSQMMVEDRYFYDAAAGRYTVDRYLDDVDQRYGGIDSVLIWPVYPNVGIDNRNQHDLLRDLPGGLEGVRKIIDDFHRRGVHVLFPMMPWEAGTRQEGVSLAKAVARDFQLAGIDGVNGDTMPGIAKEFPDAAEAVGHSLAFQPEDPLGDLAQLQWDSMNWGYWSYSAVPVVDRYKWFESRHLTNVCERWAKDHTEGLQAAFFNGDGFESWENIWGIWNGMTPRDSESLRRVALIERGLADLLSSPDWTPHVPTLQPGIYASMFPSKESTAWLFVNRSDKDLLGAQIEVPSAAGNSYYDLWHGVRLEPRTTGDKSILSFAIEANGFGAFLVRHNSSPPPRTLQMLLKKMAELSRKPLAGFSRAWKPLPQELVSIALTVPVPQPPEGMVPIPAADFHFKVKGVEIEGWGDPLTADQTGVDFQYPWEAISTRSHEHEIQIAAFYIDKYPVTNEEFKKFIDSSHYHPADDHHFLRDWADGTYPKNWARKPVTWVSLEDARAYASWAGKRLPHEWEWQYAAQGLDGRPYPWGTGPNPNAVPKPVTGHDLTGPADVDAFPQGASPFGVMDLVGNIWQWTDEYQDEHTRAAVVRGDSYYQPQGSLWYFPRNPTLDLHGKYLLMCPGKDRAGTLGFRCVKDR